MGNTVRHETPEEAHEPKFIQKTGKASRFGKLYEKHELYVIGFSFVMAMTPRSRRQKGKKTCSDSGN